MKLPVATLSAGAAGDIDLDDAVYGIAPTEIRRDILHRVVRWQLAKRRAGTHRSQLRGEVNRTKAKWFRQKGTGRARHGAQTPGIFRGGAKAHGPKPRSYEHAVPKKVRRMALRHALSAKAGAGELIVLDAARMDEPKTKVLRTALDGLEAADALIIDGAAVDPNFQRAAGNLPKVDVLPVQGLNVYDVLRRKKLILTRDAVAAIDAFFEGAGWPNSAADGEAAQTEEAA